MGRHSQRSAIIFTIDRILSRSFEAISSNLEKIGGALIVVMMLTIVVEGALRTFWGLSTRIAYDLVGILLGCAIFLGLAKSYRMGAHIRIKSLVMRLPERIRNVLDVVVLLITLIYAGFIFKYSLSLALGSLRIGALSQTPVRLPLFPFQIIVPIGTGVFIIILLVFRSASRSGKERGG
jgi:TRAP-type C4-dicarboxylate transport system permease small subunit